MTKHFVVSSPDLINLDTVFAVKMTTELANKFNFHLVVLNAVELLWVENKVLANVKLGRLFLRLKANERLAFHVFIKVIKLTEILETPMVLHPLANVLGQFVFYRRILNLF